MRKHTSGILILVLLSIPAVIPTIALTGYAQEKSTSTTEDEATPIQKGVMTERQKKHSKLYKGSGMGENLSEVARKDGSARVIVESSPSFSSREPTPTLGQSLNELACTEDAIVVGKVKSKASQLTEEEDFVFTDYELSVEEVIKNNPSAQIGAYTEITITRPGGVVLLDGRVISADVAAYNPFKVGSRYITFLNYISND